MYPAGFYLANDLDRRKRFKYCVCHYGDVIMSAIASQITSLTIVYSIQTQIKENIKAPRHWPLCGEFTGDRWIPRTNGQWCGKCFQLMMSSWCLLVDTTTHKPMLRLSGKAMMPVLDHLLSNSDLIIWVNSAIQDPPIQLSAVDNPPLSPMNKSPKSKVPASCIRLVFI